jgi:ribosome-associated translation inhibitor RaiA
MQITVRSASPAIVQQTRAYTEYRMFSAVSRFGGPEDRLSVQLDCPSGAIDTRYRCAATLEMNHGGRVRAHASANLLFEAIDTAAKRLAARVARRLSAGGVEPPS